ncbi:UDP-galactopyranose mutase [Bacteroides sp. 519]|uniref:UDP-galactopyranose mutase n=1 Tax=Bacteroides sp. 519 TaxID=2302937 RepID=UPI0013D8DBA2|nr:UDP-galactopyranose mutase [Bacteroides sp. 519]NDV58036.1 UDP-galactopyranose mutase [Bacteroides sp. 519]
MSKKEYDYLIVGSGLFGAVFAEQMHLAGKRCLVVEKRTHSGGNIYCENMADIQVHKYGAHIMHTSNKEVWDYVNSFVEFNRYTNSPLACYQNNLYNLPFNMNTFKQLWGVNTPAQAKAKLDEQRGAYADIEPSNLEEQALKLCGKDIYYYLIKGYTEKQWGREATKLPAFIIKRIPFRFIYDNNYFNDTYQGIPHGGYNALINALLQGVEVRLNVDYLEHRAVLNNLADKILFTGCIDEYFDCCLGRLEYRSLRFEHEHLDIDNYQGNAVVNYTEREIPFTRIIEHKHFEFGTQASTVITREYPDEYLPGKEPYYPVNDQFNTQLYKQYTELAAKLPNVLFGGRLAQYAYLDMDDTIELALNLVKKELIAN